MQIDMEKMKKLLALELPQSAVASALGCSESLVSQKMTEADFIADVAALKLARLEDSSQRDEKLDKLENTIIDKLEKGINYMLKPQDLLGALKVISAVPRRSQPNMTGASVQLSQTVKVVLPNVMAVTFIKNTQGEIIEAGGRSLATLPSKVLKQMALPNQQSQPRVGVIIDGNQTERISEPRGSTEGSKAISAAAA